MYKEVLDITNDIYQTVYESEHWGCALEKLCRLLSAKSGGLFMQDASDKTNNALYTHNMPKPVRIAYNLGLGALDPGFKIMAKKEVGKTEVIVGDDVPVSPIYKKLVLSPSNIHYAIGLNIFKDEEWHVGLGIHRSKEAGPFTKEEMDLISNLTPHFQRALKIKKEFSRLNTQQDLLNAGLSHIALGIILLNNQGKPSFISPIAQNIVDSHPVLHIADNGSIKFSIKEQDVEFHLALQDILSSATSPEKSHYSFTLQHPKSPYPLAVMMRPHEPAEDMEWSSFNAKGVVIYLNAPESGAFISSEQLRENYNLTEAESHIAINIANGLTLEQIAKGNKVSINTVKTQLRSIFQKTNTTRQTELIITLLTLRL